MQRRYGEGRRGLGWRGRRRGVGKPSRGAGGEARRGERGRGGGSGRRVGGCAGDVQSGDAKRRGRGFTRGRAGGDRSVGGIVTRLGIYCWVRHHAMRRLFHDSNWRPRSRQHARAPDKRRSTLSRRRELRAAAASRTTADPARPATALRPRHDETITRAAVTDSVAAYAAAAGAGAGAAAAAAAADGRTADPAAARAAPREHADEAGRLWRAR